MDIPCRKCGEPWDSYSLRDGTFTLEEAKLFRQGKGCPSCDFGRKAPAGLDTALLRQMAEDALWGLIESTDDGDEQDELIDGFDW